MASSSKPATPKHYFPTPALDHAFSGIMAGTIATICMNPLDLIKVQFQVDTTDRRKLSHPGVHKPNAFVRRVLGIDVLQDMGNALRDIVRRDGVSGLYRGLSPNVIGNSTSWGLYFLFYTMIKEFMSDRAIQRDASASRALTPGQHLLAATESGAITALLTNPIWVVKTRMFTTSRSGRALHTASSSLPQAADGAVSAVQGTATAPKRLYNGLFQSLRYIWKDEGIQGLYKGGGLALLGVSSGAIQFMAYEELKRWRMQAAKKRLAAAKGMKTFHDDGEAIKLDNSEYLVISGAAKLVAIGLTYPYQVIRSRIQVSPFGDVPFRILIPVKNHATFHLYPNIPTCVRLTFQHEGLRGFYKGMAANAIRVLPGTCVTFVVYENCSWALRGLAERRDAKSLSTSS